MASRIQDLSKFVDSEPPIKQRGLNCLEDAVHPTILRNRWAITVANPTLESGKAIQMFGQERGDAAEFTFFIVIEARKPGIPPKWRSHFLKLGFLAVVKGLVRFLDDAPHVQNVDDIVEFGRLSVGIIEDPGVFPLDSPRLAAVDGRLDEFRGHPGFPIDAQSLV